MSSSLVILFVLGIMATLTHSQEGSNPGLNDQQALKAVVDGNTDFGTSLYNVLRKTHSGNLIFSPFSLSAVMAMVKNGAREETAEDIEKTFKFPASDEALNKGYQYLLSSLKSDGENFTLETANRIFSQDGFELNTEFVNTLKIFYNSEVKQIDFSNSVESAKEINSYVSSSTQEKITDFISTGDLDALTRLVLVNAIYFKGLWRMKFDSKLTAEEAFFLTDDSSVDVEMMRMVADLPFADIPELTAKSIFLPYKGSRLSMIILLPNEQGGLGDLVEKLQSFPPSKIPGKLRRRKVELRMPKFRLESTIDLQESLTELGLESIFDRTKANFSGVPADASETQLYVSKVFQKAFIEVNEEGSEAAATTGVIKKTKSGVSVIRFFVNRPFVAAIYDKITTSVLFFATIENPTTEKITILAPQTTTNGSGSISSDIVVQSLVLTVIIFMWSGFAVISQGLPLQ